MRLTAMFPVLCAMIALILSFLCVFAGTNHDMMEQYDLFTLNTSRIGINYLEKQHNTSTPSAKNSTSGGIFGSFIHNVTTEIRNATTRLETEIDDDINNVLRSLARDIGLHDFYSVHVMDYCEGFFSPNGTSKRNVTYCSDEKGQFSFNVTQALQRELNASHVNVTLSQIHWPSAISDGIHDLRLAFHATAVFYYMGIILTGLAFFASIVGVFVHGRVSALLNIGLAWLAFFTLMLASAIATSLATKATNVINKYGKDVDVNAARGDKFIALTWAGTALIFVAGAAWFGECIVGRRMEKKMPKQLQ